MHVLNIPSHQILSPTTIRTSKPMSSLFRHCPGLSLACHLNLRHVNTCARLSFKATRTRKPHRALYITRADANIRRVINEAEIREEVIANGFEIISLSNVPLLQQVELFSEARIIVGPHGAGFTNAVFCQPGSVLIEFMPEWYQVDCFERLARFVGMEYHSIEGVEAAVSNDRAPTNDHTVDGTSLRTLLREFI